jgi:RNA polymerase sigma factor (sigma-70 family)
MSVRQAPAGIYSASSAEESRDHLPPAVSRLLEAPQGAACEEAWGAFVACYSELLLRVANRFAQGYDEGLDRYAFMLEELRRSDYRRLRKYAADGRGRFSTWLAVVARRLCLDYHRHQYGRSRGNASPASIRVRSARRQLSRLDVATTDLTNLPDLQVADLHDDIDDRDRRERLRCAVNHLLPADRLLLRLRFEQDLTAREMATVLGLPSPFHVYRRLDAIFRALRMALSCSAACSVVD